MGEDDVKGKVDKAMPKASEKVAEAIGTASEKAEEGVGKGSEKAMEGIGQAQEALGRAAKKIHDKLGQRGVPAGPNPTGEEDLLARCTPPGGDRRRLCAPSAGGLRAVEGGVPFRVVSSAGPISGPSHIRRLRAPAAAGGDLGAQPDERSAPVLRAERWRAK